MGREELTIPPSICRVTQEWIRQCPALANFQVCIRGNDTSDLRTNIIMQISTQLEASNGNVKRICCTRRNNDRIRKFGKGRDITIPLAGYITIEYLRVLIIRRLKSWVGIG